MMHLQQDDESLLSEAVEVERASEKHGKRLRTVGKATLFGVSLVALGTVVAHSGRRPSQQPSLRTSSLQSAEELTCSAPGKSCLDSKCCSDPGMQCFAKDVNWAECRAACVPGPDPRSLDAGKWSCEQLGDRTDGSPPECASSGGEDCSSSKCCKDSGMQCFEKVDGGFGTCKVDCVPGVDLCDLDSTPWTCKALGPRMPDIAPWVWSTCAATHGDCTSSECCAAVGMQCYMKDTFYGACRENCDPTQPETMDWNCETRGTRLPMPAPHPDPVQGTVADWVAETCAKSGEDCRASSCCAEPGQQCFDKDGETAMCRASCEEGPYLYGTDNKDWSCNVLGPRTPGWQLEPYELQKEVSSWVAEGCTGQYGFDCSSNKCCNTVGDQCYQKNEAWAACSPSCAAGPRSVDNNTVWSCKELGPRTHRAYPSLFCFSVVQPFGYEAPLLKAQMNTGQGIWACDHFSVFSVQEFVVGTMPNGDEVRTQTFVPAEVKESKDHTAANAELFMHVWDAVGKQAKWQLTDWTIKVDPDAVLLPTRLRKHLDPFTGQNGYVVNCAKPFMPEGPMMFGAMEAFTKSALDTYFTKVSDCAHSLPWNIWGEDLYMGKCLEKVGVQRINDFTIYSDGVCRGVDCTDPDAAAFHPKKDIVQWMACLEQTKHPRARYTTDAPQWFKDYMKSYER
eukprot:CAMPEP_0183443128 /NCGR_PEP_ID=MMETSP0370-20130417/90737_1 /TAXON_ID=268820 /ORGANISM="Peridinium aciculiferum, Strain PAER-2" /LENGTH=676 /DNA_ID=CAMNT_0025633007 /DNA_START=66 /DNA_END=2096 /DNA_ORIENTATION=-